MIATLFIMSAVINIADYGGIGDAVTNSAGATGTDNTPALRAAYAATGTNDTLFFPAGRYLMVPPFMTTNGVMPSPYTLCTCLSIKKGGLRLLGSNATLQLPGAYQLQPYVQRGTFFFCDGPITNDLPLIFEGLTFDGGTYPGDTPGTNWFPADVSNGSGWDATHGAVIDTGSPIHSYKLFTNCTFQHWRGEIVKSISTWEGGYNDFQNCTFYDGNASAINFSFAHRVSGCSFSYLNLGMEFYQGYAVTNCLFENSSFTNIVGNCIVIVGALAGHTEPPYVIRGNSFSAGVGGILVSPGANLTITSNTFFGPADFGIYTSGAAYQGSDYNHDWTVSSNTFNGVYTAFLNGGGSNDRLENVSIFGNSATISGFFFTGYGEQTSIVISSNSCNVGYPTDSSAISGQWPRVDLSNAFAFHEIVGSGVTALSYGTGSRLQLDASGAGVAWTMEDRTTKIPPTAACSVKNATGSKLTLWLSRTNYPTSMAVVIPVNGTVNLSWNGTQWQAANTANVGRLNLGYIKTK